MFRSLRSTWRSLRGRRRLDVLDVIAEADTAVAVAHHTSGSTR